LEGPYLHSSKPGAHETSLFRDVSSSLDSVYGPLSSNNNIIKLVTVAPDIPNSNTLIKSLSSRGILVSLGHSSASFEQGLAALSAGASCLTHTLNCMSPLHQREPGLAGLISLSPTNNPPPPHYTFLCDGIHVHPAVASLLYHAAPSRAILVSDSIELAGLPDGLYPPNRQIHHQQRKVGARATIEGTDTLIGSCINVSEGIKNLIEWSGCDVANAVRNVTENVADLMGLKDRGKLEEGRRADFVILDDQGDVKETWIAGVKVWEK
jgi:N-acetylglucosamine-6-phosphate deacetylase